MRWDWSAAVLCALVASSMSFTFAGDSGCADFFANEALCQWEKASARLIGVGPMEDRRLFYLYHQNHSAHEIALVNEFRGPVSATDLQKRFKWSLRKAAGKTVMVGVPTDDVERLFYERCEVMLDPETHLPKSVRFAERGENRLSEPLTVITSPRYEEPHLFEPADPPRPIAVASRGGDVRLHSPLRVVEQVRLKTVPEHGLTAEVAKILESWESAARRVESLKAEVRCFRYDRQAQFEHRAVGELIYAKPASIRFQLKPARIAPHQTSARTGYSGSPYQLLPLPAESWEYTPTEIRFSHKPGEAAFVIKQTGEGSPSARWASHQQDRTETAGGERIIPPWRMLFPISTGDLARRFRIDRIEESLWGPNFQRLRFTAKEKDDAGRFREMEVVVEKSSGLPRAAKFTSPEGDREHVYVFDYKNITGQASAGAEPDGLPVRSDRPQREPAPTELHGQP